MVSLYISTYLKMIESYSYETIMIYFFIVVVTILCLVLFAFGIETKWYDDLNKENKANSWIALVIFELLALSILISYISILIIYRTIDYGSNITCLFLVGMFLLLFWVTTFFYYGDIGISIWIMFMVFTYFFCLSNYMWIITPFAAIPMLPLLIMFLYLIYFMIYLANTNDILL